MTRLLLYCLLLAPVCFAGDLRVVTFNLYNHPSQKVDRTAFSVRLLRELKPDVMALQEVGGGILGGSSSLDVLEDAFPESAGWYRRYDVLETKLGLYRNGLLLVSRFPLVESEFHEIQESGLFDRKGFQIARVKTPEGEVRIVNLHLLSTENAVRKRRELDEVAAALGDSGLPTILAGDFNWTPALSPLRGVLDRLGAASLVKILGKEESWITWSPSSHACDRFVPGESHQGIDHVFLLKGGAWKIKGGGMKVEAGEQRPSDHCPVYADLAT